MTTVRALVTGGASGIGAAVAARLAERGHEVLVVDLQPSPLAGVTEDLYRRIMGANVDGVVYGARAVLPGMLARGSGDIIVTASIAGLAPIPVDPVYGLTKHAVIGLVRSLGAALEGTGVCIQAICPGLVHTALIDGDATQRLGDLGLPVLETSVVADAVEQALSDRVNGSQWVVWGDIPPFRYEWAALV